MENDPIERNLPWLTPWFTNPKQSNLSLNEEGSKILNEISSCWAYTEKVALFDSLGARFRREMVGEVIDEVVKSHIMPEWAEIGQNQSSKTVDDLVRLLWEPLPSAGFNVSIKKKGEAIQIRCTRCPHAELASQINAAEWMFHLVCSGDPYMAEGFNPEIGFRRTQTLMEGHPCCDHFYFPKK